MDMGRWGGCRPGKVLEFAKWKITMWNIGQLVNHHVYHLWMAMWKIAMLNSQRLIAGEQRMYMDVYCISEDFEQQWTFNIFQYNSKRREIFCQQWLERRWAFTTSSWAAGHFDPLRCNPACQVSRRMDSQWPSQLLPPQAKSFQSFVNGDMGDSPEDPPIPTTWSYFWGFFLAGRFGPFTSGSKPPNPTVEQHHFSADMAFFYWSKSANPHFSRKSDGWAWYLRYLRYLEEVLGNLMIVESIWL